MNDAAFLRGVKKYKNHEKNLSDFVAAYRRHAMELYAKQRARAWTALMAAGAVFERKAAQ